MRLVILLVEWILTMHHDKAFIDGVPGFVVSWFLGDNWRGDFETGWSNYAIGMCEVSGNASIRTTVVFFLSSIDGTCLII